MRRMLTLLSGVVFSVATAHAQDGNASYFQRDRNVSVSERPKPEYSPLGIRAGTFMVRPKVTASAEYSDNIYVASQNEVEDTLFEIAPEVSIQSDWSQHAFGFQGKVTHRTYSDNSDENSTDLSLRTNGVIDVRRGTRVDFGASYDDTHELRRSVDSLTGAAEPIVYSKSGAFVRAQRESGRFKASGQLDFTSYDYDDVLLNNGTLRSLSDRNRDEVKGQVRGDYAVGLDTAVFVRAEVVDHNYDDTTLINRNQSGWALDVGSEFDLSELLRGEVGLGYFERTYDDAAFDDVTGLSAHGLVEWFPSPLHTVTFMVQREELASGVFGAPSYTLTALDVGTDYEVLRNLILSAGFTLRDREFQGLDRSDDEQNYYLGGTYFMNRNVGVNFRASHLNLDSSGNDGRPEFDVNTITVGIVVQK